MAHGAKGLGEALNEKSHTRVERIFFWLKRINAVGIFVFLCFMLWMAVQPIFWNGHYYSDWDEDRFGAETKDQELEYVGEEYETDSGTVNGYFYGGEPDMDRGKASSGLTLINPATGKQISVVEKDDGSILAGFQTVQDEDSKVVAYLARVSRKQDYATGRASLILGSMQTLEQVQIAANARYLDATVLTADGNIAVVFWPDEQTARLVSINLQNLELVEASQLALPPPVQFKELGSPPGTDENASLEAVAPDTAQ